VDLRSNDVHWSRQGHSKGMLNGQSEQGRRETDRGQRATGEELGSERAIFPIEKGHAALVFQGKFASADAESLGAVLQELVRNGML